MDNNVILAIASTLVDKSLIAFMFNFRGVGGSEGSFGEGVAEREDVAAAICWVTSQPGVDEGNVGLLGYSFGATVALPVACDDELVKAVALISPPVEASQVSQLKDCAKPKLIVCGTDDFVVSPEIVELIGRDAAEPKHIELVPGADHFWQGYEAALAEKVAAFFHRVFAGDAEQ